MFTAALPPALHAAITPRTAAAAGRLLTGAAFGATQDLVFSGGRGSGSSNGSAAARQLSTRTRTPALPPNQVRQQPQTALVRAGHVSSTWQPQDTTGGYIATSQRDEGGRLVDKPKEELQAAKDALLERQAAEGKMPGAMLLQDRRSGVNAQETWGNVSAEQYDEGAAQTSFASADQDATGASGGTAAGTRATNTAASAHRDAAVRQPGGGGTPVGGGAMDEAAGVTQSASSSHGGGGVAEGGGASGEGAVRQSGGGGAPDGGGRGGEDAVRQGGGDGGVSVGSGPLSGV
ncbi:hypothetical protein HYH02_002802 [Chlamydomonas schloesseri]|uniref:Uncharacterized protein n=1 Tax=Chlamydomonas schloesseri TaxID=2026947 RepID=A0A835WU60_9CHLO|nr:hypothetical protein HYH02_002802 [Chlamydomonas schloesseri]|eukprot:KAG2452565.1 hypothetical protein HYH02_002802 [Chlamydomonas schloesseri]